MEIKEIAIVSGITAAAIGIGYLGYKTFAKKDDEDDEFINDISSKAKKAAADIFSWAVSNPEKTALIVTSCAATINTVRNKQTKTRIQQDRTYYDPRTGFHWTLNRTPTNYDRMTIDSRLRAGENAGQILRDLRLI